MNLNKASLAQDRAAGGPGRRKMRIRSGEIVTVSLVVMVTGKDPVSRVHLRFRSGGVMVTRPVGNFVVENTFEVLKLGWAKVRAEKLVEQFEWSWIEP